MALGPPFIISIERSSGSISRRGDAGNPGLVRSPQVAANFFQPGFRDGGIVFEIGFKSEDVAELFRREFGGAAHSTCDRRSDDRPPCSAPILCSSA